MGLFFGRKKKAEMEIPPPPPPEGGAAEEAEKPEAEMPAPAHPAEPSAPEAETHMPSELPEIKPEKHAAPMPVFPEIPEEELEEGIEEVHKPAMPHAAKPRHAAPLKAGQRFVSISSFQTVLAKSDEIKGSLKEAEALVGRLNELRNEEDKEFQKWRMQLENVDKKLTYIDQAIFKGE